MKEFLLRLWTDESFFERCVRSLAMGIGQCFMVKIIDFPGSMEIGILLTGGALMIPAGQKNPKPPVA